MKLWADWLADNPRDYARCPGLTISNSSQNEAYYLHEQWYGALPQMLQKESLEKAGLIDTSSAMTSISSHAGQRESIAHATRLTLSQSIASTLSCYAVKSANTTLSLATCTIWMRRDLC
jgi:hypothetical protein